MFNCAVLDLLRLTMLPLPRRHYQRMTELKWMASTLVCVLQRTVLVMEEEQVVVGGEGEEEEEEVFGDVEVVEEVSNEIMYISKFSCVKKNFFLGLKGSCALDLD